MDALRKREATRLRVQRFRAVRRKIETKTEITEVPGSTNKLQGLVSTDNADHLTLHLTGPNDLIIEHRCDNGKQHNENESGQATTTCNQHMSMINEMQILDPPAAASEENRDDQNGIFETEYSTKNICGSAQKVSGEEKQAESDRAEDEVTQLRQWAMNSNIPQVHLDALLGILRKKLIPNLPVSSKTFLKTSSAEYEIQELKNFGGNIGKFVYFGMTKHLQDCVNVNLHQNDCLDLQINIDGLPLFKSSNVQFWPILCKVYFQPDVYAPFPIAVYVGSEKPNDLHQYLENFVEEMNELLTEGIVIDEKVLKVRIHCFICDTPARSFVKCIKSHGGYYACERCTVRGERFDNRTIYSSATCQERSDRSFRNQEEPEHHTSVSPLVEIKHGFDMVFQFILDFMHLCCLGVMKKLLEFWLRGNRETKLSQNNKILMSQILIGLRHQIPSDFQRTTRSIYDVSKWKATEFRFFLLYCGPIILKRVLQKQLFKHFLLFHTACRILCSKEIALKYNNHAKFYLIRFVKLSRYYYGRQIQVMNFHNLIHLADDVKNLKCPLSEVTAFPFENALGKMKKMLRSGNRPLAQLCRRLHETFFANVKKPTLPPSVVILKQQREDTTGIIHVKKIKYKEAILSTKSPDNTVLLQDGKIMQIKGLTMQSNQILENLQMASRTFKLIEFIEDTQRKKKSIDFVPADWITYDVELATLLTTFMPPPYTNEKMKLLSDLIKGRQPPPESWPKFAISIIGEAKSIEDAEKKLKILEKEKYAFSTDNEEHAEAKILALKKSYRLKKTKASAKQMKELLKVPSLDDPDSEIVGSSDSSPESPKRNLNFDGTPAKKTQASNKSRSQLSTEKNSKKSLDSEKAPDINTQISKSQNRLNTEKIPDGDCSSDSIINDSTTEIEVNPSPLVTLAENPSSLTLPEVQPSSSNSTIPSDYYSEIDITRDTVMKAYRSHNIQLSQIQTTLTELKSILQTIVISSNSAGQTSSHQLPSDGKTFAETYNIPLPFQDVTLFDQFDQKLQLDQNMCTQLKREMWYLIEAKIDLTRSITNIFKKYLSRAVLINFTAVKKCPG